MRYGSVCSGIEAATVAWHPLGWRASWLSEIEPFPCSLLAHHYPAVPNRGDMTKFQDWPDDAIDLLVGGTPCQSFSIAGLRAGLADPRGNLMLTYLAIAAKYRPRWLVWENVPGVLSSNGGRDFGTFLRGLGELGYGFAYRVLDAQLCRASGYHRAVPQRRRRVFVVGHLGDWRRAAAVLFDGQSMRGDLAPSREARQTVAPTISSRPTGGGGLGTDFDLDGGLVAAEIANVLETTCHDYSRADGFNMVAHTLRGEGYDASEDGGGRGTPIVPVAFNITPSNSNRDYNAREASYAQAITSQGGVPSARGGDVVTHEVRPINTMVGLRHEALGAGTGLGIGDHGDAAYTLSKAHSHAVQNGWAVRRLTPTECERLQGFPDGYTAIQHRGKPAADGPRYKALGNSMAVNVMRVIGERIALVEALPELQRAAA